MGPIMSHSPPNSDRLAAASHIAMELLQQGKAAEAQTVLHTVLQGGGAGAMTWVLLGKAQQMANDYAGMADSAASARALQPHSAASVKNSDVRRSTEGETAPPTSCRKSTAYCPSPSA